MVARVIDPNGVHYENLKNTLFRDHTNGRDVFIQGFEVVKIQDNAFLRSQQGLKRRPDLDTHEPRKRGL